MNFIPALATVVTRTCPALWARFITAKHLSICDRFLLILLFLRMSLIPNLCPLVAFFIAEETLDALFLPSFLHLLAPHQILLVWPGY
jgi:hypothetical protein